MEPGQLSEGRAGPELSVKKLDLYRKLKAEYVTPRAPALVATTIAQYLTVSGRGGPKGADLGRARRVLLERGRAPGAVRLERLREGRVGQMLQVGPYDREPKSIGRMREFARARGLQLHGRHHEIYLSDPRRVAPAKLRTILGQPVRPRPAR